MMVQYLTSMLSLSLLIVVMGSYISTRTESVSIAGYMSGIIVSINHILNHKCNKKKIYLNVFVFNLFSLFSISILTMRPIEIVDFFSRHTLGN